MGLVSLPGLAPIPLISAGPMGHPVAAIQATTAINAASLSLSFIGYCMTEDGQSHTIDNTGSSAIGFRCAAVTFANAATTFNVGIGSPDLVNGPTARPANSGAAITYDVVRTLTGGGGGITGSAWNELLFNTGSVSGSKTIANGDLVAITFNMSARGGSDSIAVARGYTAAFHLTTGIPLAVTWNGTTATLTTSTPGCVITFSDGKKGWLFGSFNVSVHNVSTSTVINTGTNPAEVGNLFRSPVPMKLRGMSGRINLANLSADYDICIYADPFGTPTLVGSRSVDASGCSTGGQGHYIPFSSPVRIEPNKDYVAAIKPTTANSVTINCVSVGHVSHQKFFHMGDNGYAVQRASGGGAFTARSSQLERFNIGILPDAFLDNVKPQYHLGAFF